MAIKVLKCSSYWGHSVSKTFNIVMFLVFRGPERGIEQTYSFTGGIVLTAGLFSRTTYRVISNVGGCLQNCV